MFHIYVLCVCFSGIEFSYHCKERHVLIRMLCVYFHRDKNLFYAINNVIRVKRRKDEYSISLSLTF